VHAQICYTCVRVLAYVGVCLPHTGYGVATISRLLKIKVSFAKEPCKRDDILQKRPTISRSLLFVATPYLSLTHFIVCMCCAAHLCMGCREAPLARAATTSDTPKWHQKIHSNEPNVQSKEPYIDLNEPYVTQATPALKRHQKIKSNEPNAQSKEPYIDLNQPYVHPSDSRIHWNKPDVQSKEPYIDLNEPYAHPSDSRIHWNEPKVPVVKNCSGSALACRLLAVLRRKRAMYRLKRAIYRLKLALCTTKRLPHTLKRAKSTSGEKLLRLCISLSTSGGVVLHEGTVSRYAITCVAACCRVLQFVAVCYSMLQCAAVCCSVL